MKFIGITGGVGAGKSEILGYLDSAFSSQVVLTDLVAHELMEPGTDCYKELQKLFHNLDVYEADGTFAKEKLARVLFGDEQIRNQLNDIVHPAVKNEVNRRRREAEAAGEIDLFVVESALLLEGDYQDICDEVWYIFTSEEERRSRLKASRGYSDAKIDSILASQLSEDVFRKKCSLVIDNNGSTEESFAQIEKALEERGIRHG